ncbi:right-handed parallel beta-helix repeat-containing protein [Nanoarchaeota archaeon]
MDTEFALGLLVGFTVIVLAVFLTDPSITGMSISASAPINPSCGDDIPCGCGSKLDADRVLNDTDQLEDCTGTALIINGSYTLDCDHHNITGIFSDIGIYSNHTVTIKNCNINTFETGIWLEDSSGSNITNNNISKNSAPSSGIHLKNVNDTEISFNEFSQNDNAIYAVSCKGLDFLNNSFQNNYGNGITMIGSLTSDHLISGNFFSYNMKGIGVYDEEYVTITKNDFEYQYEIAIDAAYSHHITVDDNHFLMDMIGISFDNIFRSNITNNNISNQQMVGILLGGGEFSQNLVENNYISTGEETGVGLYIADDNNTIKDNTIECLNMISHQGIIIESSRSLIAEHNRLSGNDVSGCGVGLNATFVNVLDVSQDSYHDNYIGIEAEMIGPSTTFTDMQIYDNCQGADIGYSNVIFNNPNFYDNHEDLPHCNSPEEGLYLSENGYALINNGNFQNNSDYGIYDDSVTSAYWLLTEDTYCKDNDIQVEGWIIPLGGRIIADNCIVAVGEHELDIPGGEMGYVAIPVDTTGGPTTMGSPEMAIETEIHTNTPYNDNIEINFYTTNPGGSGFYLEELGIWINISPTVPIDLDWMILKVYYTHELLAAAGLTEDSLVLEYFNETSGLWETFDPPRGGVNTEENYVWANVTHFSIFGIGGSGAPQSRASSGGGSGGGSSGRTYYITLTEEGIELWLRRYDRIKFDSNGESHTLTLKSTDQDKITLNVKSESTTFDMNLGESVIVDLNQDNLDDVAITYVEKNHKAKLKLSLPPTAEPPKNPALDILKLMQEKKEKEKPVQETAPELTGAVTTPEVAVPPPKPPVPKAPIIETPTPTITKTTWPSNILEILLIAIGIMILGIVIIFRYEKRKHSPHEITLETYHKSTIGPTTKIKKIK